MKYVAYYRTRPSEPSASVKALDAQREAVRELVAREGLNVVAEFTDSEGEDDHWPAYHAAVQIAIIHKEAAEAIDVTIIIASHDGIGSGQSFVEPFVEGGHAIMTYCLETLLDPSLSEISLPRGAAGPLCLYADFRPNQSTTCLYFCNATGADLTDVEMIVDSIDWSQHVNRIPAERWEEATSISARRIDIVTSESCVLVVKRSAVAWDFVHRVRIKLTDAAGKRHAIEANDWSLNSLGEDGSASWTVFDEIRT